MIQTGEVLAGKYRVEQVLGKGGMGYIVSAIHTQLNERVAVKFMMPELCEHQEAVARFLREARAAVRIRSEHVARVRDVGTLDDGTPYTVMEFLSGHDLATELERVHHLDYTQAVDYVLQACEALAEAHSYGIIHRDLKPANLFLTRRPDGSALIKILDFGISKDLLADMEAPASLTASQSLIGSPHYMSPEQVRHPKLVDSRSDVWALGVILHELIVGERPFAGDTPMSVLAAVVSDAPVKLRSLRREAPAELENVVLRCLEKDPARRFANVAELARALEPWATPASRPLVARIEGIVRTASGSTPPELRPISSSPRFETSETLPSPRYVNSTLQTGTLPPSTPAPAPRRALWLWGAAALGAVGGVIYVLRSSHSTRPTATTVTTATLVGASDSASSLASNAPHAEEPRVELAPPSGASSGVIAPSATVTSEPAARVVSRPGGHKGRPRATGAPASSGAPVNSSSPAGPSAQASSRPAASASAKPGAGDTDILSERR